MAISLVAVGQKITASLANWLIGKANGQGLSLLAPSSVSGTGASMTSLGTVNLSGCGSVTINGVFSSSYTNYRILIDVTLSTGDNVVAQLSAGGTPNATSNYDAQRLVASAATVAASQSLGTTGWQVGASVATNTEHSISIDIFGPALASPCTGIVDSLATQNPMTTAAASMNSGIANRLTSAFDGFNIHCATATMIGTIQVFGYNVGT